MPTLRSAQRAPPGDAHSEETGVLAVTFREMAGAYEATQHTPLLPHLAAARAALADLPVAPVAPEPPRRSRRIAEEALEAALKKRNGPRSRPWSRREAGFADQWTAIDDVPAEALAASEFALCRVPHKSLVEPWAAAVADVHARFLAEQDQGQERRDRALLWILALPQLLWRKPWYSKRGPVKAGVDYHARFDLFRQGRLSELVSWWKKDRSRLRARLRLDSGAAPPRSEAAVVVRCGSSPPASSPDAAVCRVTAPATSATTASSRRSGLNTRSGRRRCAPATSSLRASSASRSEVDLIGKLRRLPRHVGVGPDGVSNELLAALDRFHFDARAVRVMPLLNEFCTLEVNGDLPPWWYAAVTLIKLVALLKDGGAGVRPIALGSGVRDGAACYAAAARLALESAAAYNAEHKDDETFVPRGVFSLDKKNAFNELSRASIVASLRVLPGFGGIARYAALMLAPESSIVLSLPGAPLAPFRSCEGWQQGDAMGALGYGAATYARSAALVNAARDAGGSAAFFADDAWLEAPVDTGLALVAAYGAAIAPDGEVLQERKCSVLVPGLTALEVAALPALRAHATCEIEEAGGALVTRLASIRVVDDEGLVVCGVPIGTPSFAQGAIATKVTEMCSYTKTINDKLCSVDPQSAFALLRNCSARRLDFLASNAYPSDGAAYARFDVASTAAARARRRRPRHLERHAREPAPAAAPVLRRRRPAVGLRDRARSLLRSPLRRRVKLSDRPKPTAAAFDGGETGDGFLAAPARWRSLLAGPSRLASELKSAWLKLTSERARASRRPTPARSRRTRACSTRPSSAPGSRSPSTRASPSRRTSRPERRRRSARSAKAAARELRIDARKVKDDGTPRAASFFCVDRFSSAFLSTIPVERRVFSAPEWGEANACYFGTPSPLCAPLIGRTLPGGAKLDAYGAKLSTEHSVLNLESRRTDYHNAVLAQIHDSARQAGLAQREPRACSSPRASRPRAARGWLRARRGRHARRRA
ncbi:hypothetical protein JL720_15928 [Aureococcus anophagefferens]|nr:hypothetical protein JL720_15928 [Aureococcus anophagefferens]